MHFFVFVPNPQNWDLYFVYPSVIDKITSSLISTFLIQINLDYYCIFCNKTIKLKSKNNHFKSLMHIQYAKYFGINHAINNPDTSEIDKILNDYITKHIWKFEFYLVKCDFKLDYDNNFKPNIRTDFYDNIFFVHLKTLII